MKKINNILKSLTMPLMAFTIIILFVVLIAFVTSLITTELVGVILTCNMVLFGLHTLTILTLNSLIAFKESKQKRAATKEKQANADHIKNMKVFNKTSEQGRLFTLAQFITDVKISMKVNGDTEQAINEWEKEIISIDNKLNGKTDWKVLIDSSYDCSSLNVKAMKNKDKEPKCLEVKPFAKGEIEKLCGEAIPNTEYVGGPSPNRAPIYLGVDTPELNAMASDYTDEINHWHKFYKNKLYCLEQKIELLELSKEIDREKIEELEEKNHKCWVSYHKKNSRLMKAEKKIEDLEQAVNQANVRGENNLNYAIDSSSEEIKELEQKIEASNARRYKAIERIKELEQKIEVLSFKLKQSNDDCTSNLKDIGSLTSEIDTLNGKLISKANEVQRLESRQSELTAKLTDVPLDDDDDYEEEEVPLLPKTKEEVLKELGVPDENIIKLKGFSK